MADLDRVICKEKRLFFYKLGGNGLTIINNEKKKDEKWEKMGISKKNTIYIGYVQWTSEIWINFIGHFV